MSFFPHAFSIHLCIYHSMEQFMYTDKIAYFSIIIRKSSEVQQNATFLKIIIKKQYSSFLTKHKKMLQICMVVHKLCMKNAKHR